MQILTQNDEHQLHSVISERSAFGARDKAMLILAVTTGLRVGELVGLRIHHVCGAKPAGGRMVRHQLALPAEVAKGARPRIIPLNAEAREAVLNILIFNHHRGFAVTPEAPLFPNRKHQPMSTRAVRRMLEKYCVAADLDMGRITPHGLRHTFGSRLVSQATTHHVQQILGHVRLSSTQVYLHSAPDQLAAAVARISRV